MNFPLALRAGGGGGGGGAPVWVFGGSGGFTDEPGDVKPWVAGDDGGGFETPSGAIAEAEEGEGGDRTLCSFSRSVALLVNVAHEVFLVGNTAVPGLIELS